MIGIEKKEIQSIPCLIIADIDKEQQALPTVTYFHGFTSAKEHNLPIAFLLAEKGFRVLLPDSIYHGERNDTISMAEKQLFFWEIVLQNIQDLKELKTYLDHEGLIKDGKFGVAGTSMGGITTSAALTKYSWIKVAAVLMGSPKLTEYAQTLVSQYAKEHALPLTENELVQLFRQIHEIDLSKHPETLQDRPLLFWHGTADTVVPYDHSYHFYKEVHQHYQNQELIHYLTEKNRGHKVSRFATLETVKWFEKHL